MKTGHISACFLDYDKYTISHSVRFIDKNMLKRETGLRFSVAATHLEEKTCAHLGIGLIETNPLHNLLHQGRKVKQNLCTCCMLA